MARRSKAQPAARRDLSVSKSRQVDLLPKPAKSRAVRLPPQNHLRPSWAFRNADMEGPWPLFQEGCPEEFLAEVYPKLRSLETRTWNSILVDDRKHHHTVDVEDLNPCAVRRLEEMRYDTQGTRLVSLRLGGARRLYGFREDGVLSILWHDRDHGDNDTCVLRSRKKHT